MAGTTERDLNDFSPDTAFAFWQSWRNDEELTDDASEFLDDVENYLLDQRPMTIVACVPLLEIVLESMRCGGRSDLKDISLLEHIKFVVDAVAAPDRVHTRASTDGGGDKQTSKSRPTRLRL